MMNVMVWVWLGVMALSAFVEAATLALVSVWFAAGALIATFAAYAGASLTVQLMLAGVFRAGLVETVSSVVLWTAFLWSFLSVPAVAEFLTELLPARRRAGI